MQICDSHNDLLTTFDTVFEFENYLKNFCINNEVVKIFTAFYVSEKMLRQLSSSEILNLMGKKFDIIKNKKIAIPTIENIGFIENYHDLDEIIAFHPFAVTLTWNYDNRLAGGAYGNGGLTKFGREVISILEQNHILIDTAHLNKLSFMEFVNTTKYPLFCSHTSSRSVYNIPRALDDEQLCLIRDSGGFVGLCLYSTLLSDRPATNKTILTHLDHIISITGDENIGIGSDFNGTGECNPVNFDIDYNGLPPLLEQISRKFNSVVATRFAGRNLLEFMENV